MLLTAGGRRFEAPITNTKDALVFAASFCSDPVQTLDLIGATISGDGAEVTREALWTQVLGLGNCSQDALNGVQNIVANAEWFSRAPHIQSMPLLSVPAISIASGPTLARHIDRLRQLQHSCLLVCADSAAKGLMAEGITPHVVTPVERDLYVRDLIPEARDMVYAGSAMVLPEVPARFKRHICVPSNDVLGRWTDHHAIGYGSSTGTMSVAVALSLTDGPVFLVGHDLSFNGASHWTGSNANKMDADQMIEGNNGRNLATFRWLKVYRDQISAMALANERIYSPSIFYGEGALIPGAKPAYLPQPGGDEFTLQIPETPVSTWRASLPERVSFLEADLQWVEAGVSCASVVEHLAAVGLCPARNLNVIESLFRPIYVQASLERRIGMDPRHTFEAMREGMRAVLRKARRVLYG